jgi:hypothetical protein
MVDVTVTTSGGMSALSAADQFTYLAPPYRRWPRLTFVLASATPGLAPRDLAARIQMLTGLRGRVCERRIPQSGWRNPRSLYHSFPIRPASLSAPSIVPPVAWDELSSKGWRPSWENNAGPAGCLRLGQKNAGRCAPG